MDLNYEFKIKCNIISITAEDLSPNNVKKIF